MNDPYRQVTRPKTYRCVTQNGMLQREIGVKDIEDQLNRLSEEGYEIAHVTSQDKYNYTLIIMKHRDAG